MTVKTMRYEIVGWQGDPKDAKARWMELADECREIVNVIWQQWEVYHVGLGNDVKVQRFAEDLRAYRRGETKDKPKLGVHCWDSPFGKTVYRKLTERFPSVHLRVVVLLMDIVKKRMSGKDVEGKWAIWQAVLMNRQGRPNCVHDQPIPFDRASCKPFSEAGEKGTNYWLEINLTRVPRPGKVATSICDRVQLKARGSGLAIMRRMVSGEYKFCGSKIVFDSSRRKWYALLSYNDHVEDVENPELTETATLHALRDSPWAFWIGGNWEWFGGCGSYIGATRRRLLTSRWSRQEQYRYAGSSNKGHGRERAMQGVEKLSRGWKDFVKTVNHQLTRAVVMRCIDRRVKRLIYLQPAGDKRETRFLTVDGKVPGREDATGWDWAQVGSLLSYKCKELGIHLEIRKCDASGRFKQDENAVKKVRRSQKRSAVVAAQ